MTMTGTNSVGDPLGILRQFVRRRRPAEICEMCAQELIPAHSHLLDLSNRKLLCACEACALLFANQNNGKYRRVPKSVRRLIDFRLSDAQWENLMIPINMAFFFKHGTDAVTALYPSPAGATESLLTFETWNDIVRDNPPLAEMEPDVEALLVNRVSESRGGGASEYFLLPIDECYKLTGLIRRHWRGLSGGAEVWVEIAQFFAELRDKSTTVGRGFHA